MIDFKEFDVYNWRLPAHFHWIKTAKERFRWFSIFPSPIQRPLGVHFVCFYVVTLGPGLWATNTENRIRPQNSQFDDDWWSSAAKLNPNGNTTISLLVLFPSLFRCLRSFSFAQHYFGHWSKSNSLFIFYSTIYSNIEIKRIQLSICSSEVH